MSAGRNVLLTSGRRLGNNLRPAHVVYAGFNIPCTPGNLDFFEQLQESTAGFKQMRNMHVTILRDDIPQITVSGTARDIEFKRGETVRVVDEDSGDEYVLTIGANNTRQPAIFTLNLQSNAV